MINIIIRIIRGGLAAAMTIDYDGYSYIFLNLIDIRYMINIIIRIILIFNASAA